jgi:uncharacterized protein YjiS (DUF1127 family)
MSQLSVLEPRRPGSDARNGLLMPWRWARSMEMWLARRQGQQDLSLLDDRLLQDIGVSREGAHWKAGEPSWRS